MYDPTIDWKLAFMIESLQIAGGDYYSLFLNSRGNVFGTGSNRYGQLGDGSANEAKIPVKMDTSNIKNPIVQIAAGNNHSLLLDNKGNVFSTGSNSHGQLGNGSTNEAKIPVKMDTSNIKNPIVQIAAGSLHSLLLDNKGNVFSTGSNSHGQLGNGSTNEAKIPVKIDTSNIKNTIVQIAAGNNHSLLLDNKGNVFSTGSNSHGQLGDGSKANAKIPVEMNTINIKNPIVQIAAGDYYSLLLDNQGNVFSTGSNSHGQLGDGSTNEAKTPVEMNTSNIKNPIVQIAAGGNSHSLLLDNRGNVFYTGQLGLLNVSRCTIPTFILNLLKS